MIEYTDEHIKITRESAQTYFDEKFSIKQRIEKLLGDEGEFDIKGVAETLGISTASANKNLSEGKKKGIFNNIDGKWFLNIKELV
jgi:Fic family protein